MSLDKKFACAINCMDGRVQDAVKHHGSKVVAIAGHFGCAGNPTEKPEQIKHLKTAEKVVKGFNFPIEVVLLWAEGNWKTVEKI